MTPPPPGNGGGDRPAAPASPRGSAAVPAAALVLLAAAAWLPAASLPFLGFDDPDYVTGNGLVREGLTAAGAAWAFTTLHAANWHPLAWLSHMLDVSLFGLDPAGHHAVNALLHGGNALLLYLFLLRATASPWRSALAAALFLVHPLRVESVAWISERKELLCAAFLLLSLHAYLGHARRPSAGRMAGACALAALALLSKPMAVTAPLLFLLLDAWPLGRTSLAPPADGSPRRPEPPRRLLLEKAPLFALSAASAAVTLYAAGRGGALRGFAEGPFTPGARLGNGAVSAALYLWKTAWPVRLAPFYPWPAGGPSAGAAAASAFLLALATGAAWRLRRRAPAVAAGWGWFLVALLPVIGLVQVGDQALADRYTYLPHVGLLAAVAWALPGPSAARPSLRLLAPLLAVAAVASLALACRHQLGYWKGDRELFVHALEVTAPGWTPPPRGGTAGEEPRKFAPVLADALRRNPNFERAYSSLGKALKAEGRDGEAIRAYREALLVDPSLKVLHNNLGGLLAARGEAEEAAFHYGEAIRLDPAIAEPRYNLATLLARRGAWDEAAAEYREALRLRPEDGDVHFNLAEVLRLGGHPDEAVPHYREALRLAPGDPGALRGLALATGRGTGGPPPPARRPSPLDTSRKAP